MFRAVLDTNVVVSSVISKKGAPFFLIQAWMDHRFTLVTSESILDEIQRVLAEPNVKDMFHITDEQIAELIETFRENAEVVPCLTDASGVIPGDPSDEKFLSAALDGKVGFLVSGDKHLLGLGIFHGIEICTPRKFLDLLDTTIPS